MITVPTLITRQDPSPLSSNLTTMSQKYGCLSTFGTIRPRATQIPSKQHPDTGNAIVGPPPIKRAKNSLQAPKFNILIPATPKPAVELPKLSFLGSPTKVGGYRSRFESF